MAVVIESVTSQATYAVVTDVGSTGIFTVTKPTGLAVGEVLFVVASTDNGAAITPPAGWSTETLPLDLSGYTEVFRKTADSADVAASNYTFTTASDVSKYLYTCYRLSGSVTSSSPITASRTVTTDDTPTSISETFSSSITPPSGTAVIIVIGKDSQTTTGTTALLSAYAITGGSITFTERADSAGDPGVEDAIAIADGVLSASSTLTGITMTADSSKTPATIFYVNVLFLYPKQNTNENVGFYSTGNTAFAPTGRAGASLTVGFATTTNTAFEPAGQGTSPTRWTNEPSTTTTWTNEE